jgi:5,10-methylenetetrahydrofolate reductase
MLNPFIEWCEKLRKENINLPVRVGFPGPASFKTLLKLWINEWSWEFA